MATRKAASDRGALGWPVHYIGDGEHYIIGFPTEGTVLVTDEAQAAELVETGLYAFGPAAENGGESEPGKEGSEA